MTNHLKYRVFFLVPPEVHLLDVCGPIQVFYEAQEYGANLELRYLGLNEDNDLKSSAGLFLTNVEKYDKYTLRDNDILFIPGLDSRLIFDESFQEENDDFYRWLNIQWEHGAKICSVCTGAYLMAFSGLLNGRRCTTHWKYLTDFKKKFPLINLQHDRLIVIDNRVYSSAGVASGIDLALYLLEELYGPFFATQIAKEIVIYLRRTDSDPQLSVFLQYRDHIENRVHQVQDELSQNLSKKQKIEDLAALVNMSQRNLTRLFKRTTGITIGAYHDRLKVERAIQLLADGQKVEAVSTSCGLSSNQLRSLLKKHADILPSKLS